MAKKQFKAQSKRLLEMMINSIYSQKEIFLRELISNASDAIDKSYYHALQNENISFDKEDFYIRLTVDKGARTLTVEDTGIAIGQAIKAAYGDKRGIVRFAHKYVPMDEALGFTALDFSGRPFLVFNAPMPQEIIGGYDSCLTEEFMRALAFNAGITLHQRCEYGNNAHHITEVLFKSLGLAMKDALRVEGDAVVSTKGVLA